MAINWNPSSWFSPSTTQNTSSTSQGTSGGTSAATGQTSGQTNVNRAYDQQIGNTFGQIPGLFDPGRNLIAGAAGPTTFGQVEGLLNPFAQSQIQANFQALQPQFQDQLSQLKGSQSANPYASSNSGAEARLRGQQANTMGQIAAGVNSQSYGQALGATQADLARQLQAGTGLTGAATQQVGLVPGLVTAGNSTTGTTGNTSQTGTTSGFNNVNTTGQTQTEENPSLFGVATGLGSLAMQVAPMFSDENLKESIEEVGATHDGQPIYTYKFKPEAVEAGLGEPGTHMGLLAQDVLRSNPEAVSEGPGGFKMVDYDAATEGAKQHKQDGGPVQGHHRLGEQIGHFFKLFHGHRQEAQSGGKIKGRPHRADGGVLFGDWNSPSPTGSESGGGISDSGWGATVERAPAAPSPWGAIGDKLGELSKSSLGRPQGNRAPASPAMADASGNPSMGPLAGIMGAVGTALAPPRAADGGRMGYADAGVVPTTDQILKANYGYEASSPLRSLQYSLASTPAFRNGQPLTGVAKAMEQENAERLEKAKLLEQNAQLTGKTAMGQSTIEAQRLAQQAGIATGRLPNGQQTLAGKISPAQIAATEAHSEEAQIRIKAREKAEAFYQQRIQAIDDMELVDKSKGANAHLYQQMRDSARVNYDADLARLKPGKPAGTMPVPPGVRSWTREGGPQP